MRILLVDDDADIRWSFRAALSRRGHEVALAPTAEAALRLIEGDAPDIAIIDIMLPDGDGVQLCREISDRWGFPTILLTARDRDSDIVVGLNSGADDYVVKPVTPDVLEARLRTVLRRSSRAAFPHADPVFRVGDLEIDEQAMEVRTGDETIALSATEYRLLLELITEQGHAVTREHLIDTVWSGTSPNTPRTVDTTIQRLRSKLTRAGVVQPVVTTLRGIGYRLR